MTAAIELIHDSDEQWHIEIRDFKEVDTILGREVLNGFCRCFVHVNRLTSTISCLHTSEKVHGRESVAFSRDLNSLVWFTIGTLREAALAIRELRAALAKRKLLEPRSDTWAKLRDFETRWEDDESFRRMRDKAAFHVDPDVIDIGLDEILKDSVDVELSRGEGRKTVRSLISLGITSLHNGLGMDIEAYGAFLEKVSGDHDIGQTIEAAFIETANSVGIPLNRDR
jgi:hypothetical protein